MNFLGIPKEFKFHLMVIERMQAQGQFTNIWDLDRTARGACTGVINNRD